MGEVEEEEEEEVECLSSWVCLLVCSRLLGDGREEEVEEEVEEEEVEEEEGLL